MRDCIETCKLVEHFLGVQDGMCAFQLGTISFSLSLSISLSLSLSLSKRVRESKKEADGKRRVFVNFTFILAGECILTMLPPSSLNRSEDPLPPKMHSVVKVRNSLEWQQGRVSQATYPLSCKTPPS